MAVPRQTSLFRFGVFEVEAVTGEVRKQGRRIKLQEKPFQALVYLLERAGELVTRDELRERLWSADTFVEFDDNLNTAIKRVREALGDSADSPRYIETVPRRGYRFLPPVERVQPPAVPPATASSPGRVVWLGGALLLAALSAGAYFLLAFAHARTASPSRITLAVLPFRNLSGDPAQDYISDGMTEELIAQLGRLYPQRLAVIARTSVMRYKNAAASTGQIGRDLNAGFILEGSIRRSAGRLHATAELVRAADGVQVWAETYDRPAGDLFSVQTDIGRRIAESLALKFLPEQRTVLARASTTSTAAYDDYLSGLYEWNRGDREGFELALAAFQRALREDPNYAMAEDGLAHAYLSLVDYRFLPAEQGVPKAEQAVAAARRLDGAIPESYVLNADLLARANPDDPGIETAYRRAIQLNPSDALGHRLYALYLDRMHRDGQAVAEMREACRLDPVSPATLTYASWILYQAHRDAESFDRARRALTLDPNFPFALYMFGRLYSRQRRWDDAIASFEKAVVSSGRTPKYLYALADTCVQAGRKDRARQLLGELREQAKTRYVPPDYIQTLADKLKT